MKGAMNGDLVVVRIDKASKRRRIRDKEYVDGEVIRILRRAHRTVVGRFHLQDQPFVVPFDIRIDKRHPHRPRRHAGSAPRRDGQRRDRPLPRPLHAFRARPRRGGPRIHRRSRRRHRSGHPQASHPHDFPDEVLREGGCYCSRGSAGVIAQRVDLRDRNIVTIDGETAKDFDDAVEVQALPNGNYLLGVHIADVAHYVTEGSALDAKPSSAARRSTFPGAPSPCCPSVSRTASARSTRSRAAHVLVRDGDRSAGRFLDHKIYKSVIRTRERMTYTERERHPHGTHAGARTALRLSHPDFERMHELYEILRTRASSAARSTSTCPRPRSCSTRPATSRRFARRSATSRIGSSKSSCSPRTSRRARARVRESARALSRASAPDAQKLEDLREILKEFKLKLRGDVEEIRPGELQRVLKEVAGRPEERFLTNIILRSMKRASYSEESTGHFALAFEHYCHFTSPIRRYPDLIVHRRLHELIKSGPLHGERVSRSSALIRSTHCSRATASGRAEEASREVMEWKKVIFMRDKVGNEYTGIVTGVAPFGLFVELDEIFVQGMVPVATIAGDFWRYHDREHAMRGDATNRELRLGDKVKIRVESIDEDRHQIEFRLLEVRGVPIRERERDRDR
jgi:ribonuclease R